ncbi:MAG: deoxynucleoside kinase [Bacteroidales bacterium]|jgi:deoxyadenosine/deoxycytidine kinase
MGKHIAIAGNIGAGKTTLTRLLSKQLNWHPLYGDVDTNPYLHSFYEDMQRWSFNLQVYYLNSRFRQVINIRNSEFDVIQDRTIYEDAYIFAPNLHSMGLMESRDFENYSSLFELMESFIKPPELLIYLRAEIGTLVRNIQRRGREYEAGIRLDYLKSLGERYEAWIENYKYSNLIILDVDNLNFEDNPQDLAKVIQKIETHMHGLFA